GWHRFAGRQDPDDPGGPSEGEGRERGIPEDPCRARLQADPGRVLARHRRRRGGPLAARCSLRQAPLSGISATDAHSSHCERAAADGARAIGATRLGAGSRLRLRGTALERQNARNLTMESMTLQSPLVATWAIAASLMILKSVGM